MLLIDPPAAFLPFRPPISRSAKGGAALSALVDPQDLRIARSRAITRPQMRRTGALTIVSLLAVCPAAAAHVYRVTSTSDSGAGSLRAAVTSVNGGSGGDTISIPAGTYILTSGELALTEPVTITGAGAASTVVSGNHSSSIFDFQDSGPNTVSGLTLRDANGSSSGGAIISEGPGSPTHDKLSIADDAFVSNQAKFSGAAISIGGGPSNDTLTVTGTSFIDNTAGDSGGAIAAGGASSSNDTFTIADSTFEGNSAHDGGAMSASGGGGNTDTVSVLNSTFEGNSAITYGGAVELGAATETLLYDTIDGNNAGKQGGGLDVNTGTIADTIVAANHAPTDPNCDIALTSQGHNIEDGNGCGFSATGDRPNTDPRLAALADNGGSTQTQALMTGSPAIDHGGLAGCPATDERGVARPQGAGCDIGAYESALPSATTSPAGGLAPTAATLHGQATNPDLKAGTTYFQWGTSAGYGSQTPAQSLGAASGPAALAAPLAGLHPGTTYHFRAVAINPDGTSYGADETFTTPTATGPPGPGGGTPSGPGGQPGAAPRLSGLRVSPAAVRRRSRAMISYRDSEAARTTLTVLMARCRPMGHGRHTKHHRARLRCMRFVRVGSFTRSDSTGANQVQLPTLLAGHKLRKGRYRLMAVARDTAGRTSSTVFTGFTIRA